MDQKSHTDSKLKENGVDATYFNPDQSTGQNTEKIKNETEKQSSSILQQPDKDQHQSRTPEKKSLD